MEKSAKAQRYGLFVTWKRFVGLVAGALVASIAARATPPALKITPLGGGDMQLTVTNGSATNSYVIYYTPNFDPGYQWNVLLPGNTGQTNFTNSSLFNPSGFYQAVDEYDLDGDGIPDWEDAKPKDPAIGILTVIIDTPANGYIFR